jgi:hypothetical protein
MKKDNASSKELRAEYQRGDFDSMERGKYTQRVREASNVVVLDPDVAAAFPNAQVVNETLRRLIELAKTSVHVPPKK